MRLTCHCGAAELRVTLADGLATARRCDCSFCRRRGVAPVTVNERDLEVVQGNTLTLYQWNTGVAQHYFCSVCGIYTHHRRRSNPDEMGVNAACLDGVSPFDFAEVPVNDGKNHSKDGPTRGTIGMLRFEGDP